MASRQARAVLAAVESLLRNRDERTDADLLRDFLETKTEAAFAALVRRHGSMVFGVCGRILENADDADDAVQATFLVLATKAHSIKSKRSLGDWLHGVARRTALKARRAAARRREMERRSVRSTNPTDNDLADVLPILDEELARLPEKYRLPIVLCDLEGQSRTMAARQLRWPEGSVAGRLARGRQLLAKQLTKRGVALSAGTLASVLAPKAATASGALITAPVAAAAAHLITSGSIAGANISAKIMALTQGVLKSMLLSKLKNILVLAIVSLGMVGGVGLIIRDSVGAQLADVEKKVSKTADDPATKKADAKELAQDDPPKALPKIVQENAKKAAPAIAIAYPGGGVRELAISRDGQTLVIGCPEGFLYVFDLPTGTLRHQLHGHSSGLWCVAISPDGQTLASGSGEYKRSDIPGEIILWDLATGTLRKKWKAHQGPAFALDFSPDSKTLYSCGWDEVARVWDASTGEEKAVLRGHKGPVRRIHCVNGKLLLSGGFDSAIRAWSLATLKEVAQFPITRHEGLATSALTSDGKWLITGSRNSSPAPDPNIITVWDIETGKEIRTIEGPTLKVTGLAVSPDNKLLAMGGGQTAQFNAPKQFGEVKVLDLVTGAELAHFEDHQEFVAGVAFSPDGRWLVSGSGRGAGVPGELRLRDMTQMRLEPKQAPPKPVLSLWLVAGAVALLLGLLGFGVWLFVRRRSSETSAATAETTSVSFACKCGKDLKAKAASAGKQVKCPGCGILVLVPNAK